MSIGIFIRATKAMSFAILRPGIVPKRSAKSRSPKTTSASFSPHFAKRSQLGSRARDFQPELTIVNAIALFAISLSFAIASAGCTRKALPEADSPGGQVYVQQCGQCHAPYNPRSMTAAMWRVQVPMMEDKMKQSGLPALSDADRTAILDYLGRNASN